MPTNEPTIDATTSPSRLVSLPVFKGRGLTQFRLDSPAPFGWWPAVILSLVSFLDRLEQSVVAGALPDIKEYFHLGNTGAGLIAFLTSAAGVVLFIPAGRIADRTKRTRALAFVLV